MEFPLLLVLRVGVLGSKFQKLRAVAASRPATMKASIESFSYLLLEEMHQEPDRWSLYRLLTWSRCKWSRHALGNCISVWSNSCQSSRIEALFQFGSLPCPAWKAAPA